MMAYNHGPFIAQAIEGVLMQDADFEFELVIGEDCSTDGTRETVLEYQRKFPGIIRVITSERNVGAQLNFERIVSNCRGEYMAMCEGDDYWCDPRKLRMQAAILESNRDVMMVAHRAYKVDVNDAIVSTFPGEQPSVVSPADVIVKGGGFFATNSMMFRGRLLVDRPAWFDVFPAGDAALMNLALSRGKIAFLNDIMSAYRVSVPGSWSQRKDLNLSYRLRHMLDCAKAFRLLAFQKRHTFLYMLAMAHMYRLAGAGILAWYVKKPIMRVLKRS
jgi:glycosyltransferase involved in cell wall biosynthesis